MSVCKECQAKFNEVIQICEKCGSDDIEVVRKMKKEIVRFVGGRNTSYERNVDDFDDIEIERKTKKEIGRFAIGGSMLFDGDDHYSKNTDYVPYYTPMDDFYSNPKTRQSFEQAKKDVPFVAITSPKEKIEFFTPNKTIDDGHQELPKLGYGDFIDEEYGKQLMDIGKHWKETKELVEREKQEIYPAQLTFEERYPESNKYIPSESLKKLDEFFNEKKKKEISIKDMYIISLYRWIQIAKGKRIYILCPFCINANYQSDNVVCMNICKINHEICGNKKSLYNKYVNASLRHKKRKTRKYAKKIVKLIKKEIKKINKKERLEKKYYDQKQKEYKRALKLLHINKKNNNEQASW